VDVYLRRVGGAGDQELTPKKPKGPLKPPGGFRSILMNEKRILLNSIKSIW
jgi:hypothetical protein